MRFFLAIFLFLSVFAVAEDKTVLVAILARNKAHVLPRYLRCIENLDYDKQAMTLYINTNNNEDQTEQILEEWITANRDKYHEIIFENHTIQDLGSNNPHDWTPKRFKTLGTIRTKSLRVAKEKECDYYFVADCDNFITPATLKILTSKNKPIIAPMLLSIPENRDPYSNFFCDITEQGYYKAHPQYWLIWNKVERGIFKVPVVHCTYLIQNEYLDDLSYIDGTWDFEFVIFSRIARERGIDQYICNEENFGVQLHFWSNLSLSEEASIARSLLAIP